MTHPGGGSRKQPFSGPAKSGIVTVARGEKAQFLTARVAGSILTLPDLEKVCCLEPPPGCVINTESIGKLL